MENNRHNHLKGETLTLKVDHNPYDINYYHPRRKRKDIKTVVMPIFNYQGDNQYLDLILEILDHGYEVVTINLLTFGDRVLFFNYYYNVFKSLTEALVNNNKLPKRFVLVAFGVAANLASYMNLVSSEFFTIEKIMLISPLNRYKGEYRISHFVGGFSIPTYIYYGQFDSVNDISSRYLIFQAGKNNPNVHFSCYPANGFYLYYQGEVALQLEDLYRKSDFDLLVGETSKSKIPFLPAEPVSNEVFYTHFFNSLADRENKKRIALLEDVCPLFINGVAMVVNLLKKELDAMGYETYIVGLWNRKDSLTLLPSEFHIPVLASYARFVPDHKTLMMLKSMSYRENAKMLAMFGFDYLHLHTEYSMSGTALELAKLTGIKMPYTYHTLWRIYYRHKFGKLMGDITYKAARGLLFNRVYKESPVIIVPSKKSYEILKKEVDNKDIRIIPSAIDVNKFTINKEDASRIKEIKEQYNLKDKKVMGYVGRVSTEKNIIELINYLAKVKEEIPNIVLMIIGVGDALPILQKHASKLGVEENIIYVGQVNNDELKYYYAALDVFVTASNFETQGLTYFEAATVGVPILAKEDKALEGVFEDRVNAFIYKDYAGWMERLEIALFQNNKNLTTNAKKTMEKYTPTKWAKQIIDISKELND